jgi:glucokinase
VSFVCGVDLGGTTTKVVVVDAELRLLEREVLITDEGGGPTDIVERLGGLFSRLEDVHGELTAVGISMAGLIDSRGQVVEAPNLTSFVGFDMLHALRELRPKLHFTFENDVNCAVVGEHRHGAGRGLANVCMLSLGTGVGGGVIIDGELFTGAGALAGELGHMVLDVDGPICTCGKPGHVEAFLSTSAIIARARQSLKAKDSGGASALAMALSDGEELSPRLVAKLAAEGDVLCCELLAALGRYLGAACASVAHVLHPQLIIIGGGVSGAGSQLMDPTRQAFEDFAMDSAYASVRLGLAELGPESAAIGAARLALDSLSPNSSET